MKSLLLFDVDGTLAESTLKVKQNMIEKLIELKEKDEMELAIVGGGTYEKIVSQIGKENFYLFSYIFSENGLVSYKQNEEFHTNNLKKVWGEKLSQSIINTCLEYIIKLDIPFKRGSFIRFRNGMLYVTPMGGDCSLEERAIFAEYDNKHNVRTKMVNYLLKVFENENVDVRIGGQIGIGIHPKGWDKSYIYDLIDVNDYRSITFFGDKCSPNGNDYPLFSHNLTSYSFYVKNPEHTLKILTKINKKNLKYNSNTKEH